MKFRLILVVCLFFSAFLHAQDITGIWRGYFNSGYGYFKQTYKYEVQIDQLQNAAAMKGLQGVTYSYHSTVFYGKALLQGIYDEKNKSLTIKETELVELKIADKSEPCLMTCYLDYRKEGSSEILEGTFTSVNANSKTDCGSGYVYLERVAESDFKKEDFLLKKPEIKTPPVVTAKPQPTAKPQADQNIRRLQTALGVTADGIAGPRTIATLKAKVPDFKGPLNASDSSAINDLIVKIRRNTAAKKSTPGTNTAKNNKPPVKKPVQTTPEKPLVNRYTDTIAKSNPVNQPPAPPEVQKDLTRKAVPVPDVIKKRENQLVKTIVTDSPDILIQLFDNGEIDGDTITVYDNNQVIANRKGLTGKPITLSIKADQFNTHHEFVMVANNLGSIPPNTALMIITTGGKRYELFISSDEKKNAKVVIDYKMPGKDS